MIALEIGRRTKDSPKCCESCSEGVKMVTFAVRKQRTHSKYKETNQWRVGKGQYPRINTRDYIVEPLITFLLIA